MTKTLLFMAMAAIGISSCAPKAEPIEIDNSLSQAEIQAGVFTPDVMLKMSRAGAPSLSPDGSTLLYTLTKYSVEQNRGFTQIYTEDLASGTVSELTDLSSSNNSPQWGENGTVIYFMSNRSGSMQVWRMDKDGQNMRQVTSEESTPSVEGFGVSPDGSKIWFVSTVHVEARSSSEIHGDMPKSKARIYDDLMVRHWDYWDMGDYRHIFVADIPAKGMVTEAVDIIGENSAWDAPLAPYFSMGEIAWSPNNQQLAYTCKPLTGAEYAVSTDSDIYIYDTGSKQTTNINKLSGKDHFVGYDKYPVWSPTGDQIAFSSMERPGNESDKSRLMVYNFALNRFTYITEEFDYNSSNVVWEDENTILFISPIEATHQICRVQYDSTEQSPTLKSKKEPIHSNASRVEVVTSGDHDITSFTYSEGKAVAALTTLSSATEYYSVTLGDGALTQISEFNEQIYDNIKMGKVEKRWVETTDGKQMLVWVVLPPDFDPTKKYPTLLYCQGGPQSTVSQFWSYRWNFQLMAAQGYIVVAPNRRGLPSFGQEWLDQISGDYSGQNIRDYLSAIDDVAKEPWVDSERLGAVGASYGGYSVFYLAGNHDKRFKAFIAHCGIFNFDSMYGETEELFFVNNDYKGSYWDKSNPTAQRSYANSPHKFVQNWDTPILIITGEYDYRIPYTQSLQAFTAARLMGLDSRLVSFEDEAHQVFKPQNSLVWNREFFAWLDKYLK